jgi:hypothetical protein
MTLSALSGLIVLSVFLAALPRPALWGAIVAAFLSIGGYLSLEWALNKSDKAFFTVFGAGFLMRLVVFGVFAWWIYVTRPAAMLSGMLTLVFSYLALLAAETFLLVRRRAA